MKKYTQEDLPRHLNNLEKAAGSREHFVADKVSYRRVCEIFPFCLKKPLGISRKDKHTQRFFYF